MTDDLTTTDDDGVTTTNPAYAVGGYVDVVTAALVGDDGCTLTLHNQIRNRVDPETRARLMQLLDAGDV